MKYIYIYIFYIILLRKFYVLQTLLFLLQTAFLCEADLVIKICSFMTATANTENSKQYKIRFSLIVE